MALKQLPLIFKGSLLVQVEFKNDK